jgi:hypothetical protein
LEVRIHFFVEHQAPIFGDLLVRTSRLVDLDHLDLHPADAVFLIPFVNEPLGGVFPGDAKNGGRAREKVHKAKLQLLGRPFWWRRRSGCRGDKADHEPQGQ